MECQLCPEKHGLPWGLPELLRYSALAGLVHYFFPDGQSHILDVGCGTGLFRHHLRYYPFSSYSFFETKRADYSALALLGLHLVCK
jgi:hypothetical protein